jgi:adenylate cyclase class IV
MAEAEVKIQLSADEFARLPALLQELGFTSGAVEHLTDYYLDYTASPHGGWDYSRLRMIDGARCLFTTKHWILDAAGQNVRLEEERALEQEECDRRLNAATSYLSLAKERWNYHGQLHGQPATVVLDHLRHQRGDLYFLECEVLVPPEQSHQMRQEIWAWIRRYLPVRATTEAMTMLELIQVLAEEGETGGRGRDI